MKQFAIDAATQVRLQSDCKIKMGAVLEKGGRILGISSNRSGSNRSTQYSRHAEHLAILNKNARGCDVYVSRTHGLRGTPLLARPCTRCYAILVEAGVKRVHYSTPTGWETIRL